MRKIVYASSDTYPVALLIKGTAFNADELENVYSGALDSKGIPREDLLFMSLEYSSNGKAPIKYIKEYLGRLMPELASLGVKTIYCADAAFFKILTGMRKAEPYLGYIKPCSLEGYEHMDVTLGVNHKSLMYNPANEPKLQLSVATLTEHVAGTLTGLGADIIHSASYPRSIDDIVTALQGLHQYSELAADIECAGLNFHTAGIGTIAFAWDQHNGIAFPVDYRPRLIPTDDGKWGDMTVNPGIRAALKNFLVEYPGVFTWHNASFDIKNLIFNLFMKDINDMEGMLAGMQVLAEKFDDTKMIAYLATNSTAGNDLALKNLAHEFAGNWAQDDIKDITKIPVDKLLPYNLVDCLSTNFVKQQYTPVMIRDQQQDLYEGLMKDSQRLIIQIELCGMPLDRHDVQVAKQELGDLLTGLTAVFDNSNIIKRFQEEYTQAAWVKDYEDRKAKAKHPENIKRKERSLFPTLKFNPNSDPQKRYIIYKMLDFPVIATTDGGQPSTQGKVIARLMNHTNNTEMLEMMEAMNAWAAAEKIMSNFMPSFEAAVDHGDEFIRWVHGNFNVNGTVSGRLSSSGPNMQNLPSGSIYGKLVKGCFKAPPGWLFVGADFKSLEDYISALTTKDPNKMKVYLDGYDGHCLRAFSYFGDEMPDIVDTVESINSIADKYPDMRQDSKAPTFALTYQGMWKTLVNNLGWTEKKAKRIEANYHDLYKVSDKWVQDKLGEASNTGYVEVAFGLRLRTPLLARTIRGHSTTPFVAEAEGRTAGNALGQSYGLLNNRAAVDFMQKVWKSPYRLDIKPVALIHDAIYLVIRDDIEVVTWVNQELIKSMEWQELPEIKHDTIKLGAELDLFWPSWASGLTVPNGATEAEISALCADQYQKLRGSDES